MLKPPYPTVQNLLRTLREARGLAQYGLAVLARTPPATILAVERYGHQPGSRVQERIAQALGVDVHDICPTQGTGTHA